MIFNKPNSESLNTWSISEFKRMLIIAPSDMNKVEVEVIPKIINK